MRNTGSVFILAVLAVVVAQAVCAEPAAEEPELWFPVGESLRYQINWGFIPVGYSDVTTEWIEEDGRRLLRIRFRTRTNRILAKLYPVDDIVESVVDPETFLPLRFVKRLSEGSYRCDELTTFNHAAGIARWESKLNGDSEEFEIKPDTRDIVSFMYYMRQHEFKPGEEDTFQVMADEKIYDLAVKAQKSEKVRLRNFGWVPSLKIEPQAAFGGVFVRKGRMWLWVSEDDRRILTKIAIQVPVASVKLYICSVGGPGDDLWTNPEKRRRNTNPNDDSEEW